LLIDPWIPSRHCGIEKIGAVHVRVDSPFFIFINVDKPLYFFSGLNKEWKITVKSDKMLLYNWIFRSGLNRGFPAKVARVPSDINFQSGQYRNYSSRWEYKNK